MPPRPAVMWSQEPFVQLLLPTPRFLSSVSDLEEGTAKLESGLSTARNSVFLALQISGDRLVQNTRVVQGMVSDGGGEESSRSALHLLVQFKHTGTNTALLKEQMRRYQH